MVKVYPLPLHIWHSNKATPARSMHCCWFKACFPDNAGKTLALQANCQHKARRQTYLDIEVNFSTSAKIWEIASCLEVGSPGIRVQLIHFFFRFGGKSALVKHLEASSQSARIFANITGSDAKSGHFGLGSQATRLPKVTWLGKTACVPSFISNQIPL